MMIFHVCGLEILMNDESILDFNWIFFKRIKIERIDSEF
jgi:hypothetical protein